MASAKPFKVKPRKARAPEVATPLDFLRLTTKPETFGTVVSICPERGTCSGLGYTSDTLDQAAQFIEAEQARGKNIYWSPNPTATLTNKKPTKTDIAEMRYAHLDLDDPSDAALAKLQAFDPSPTLIIMSGGGYNVYWELAAPIHANGNLSELESLNKKLIEVFSGDKGTHNLDRILRMPFTTNYPSKTKIARGRVPVEARLVHLAFDQERVSFDDLDFKLDEKLEGDDVGTATDEKPAGAKSDEKAKSDKKQDAKVDRSKDLMRKVAEDIAKGLEDDEIHAKRDTHDHAKDQSDPARAVQRCIDKIRQDAKSVIGKINSQNALIWVDNRLLIMWPHHIKNGLPRLSTVSDTKIFWKDHQRGKTSPVDLWLGSSNRRKYEGFTFKPGADDTGSDFNLFRGWGVAPDPKGDCSLFLAHLHEVICASDDDLYDYCIQWIAQSVQTPMEKSGTALCLRSGQGAGKGFLARYLSPIYGPHLARVGSSEDLLGKYNAYLASVVMVFADEAAWPGDRKGLEKFKGVITEEVIRVEEKFIPKFEIDNYARYICATNRDHAAPAEIDDRRYVMLDVSNDHINDKDYWRKIEAERHGTGPAALLHHLLNNVQLTRDLRETPKTAALAEQKLMGLDDVGAFARHIMMHKKLERVDGVKTYTLRWGEVIATTSLHGFYLDFAKRNNKKFTASEDSFGIQIKKFLTLVRREARTDEKKLYFPDSKKRDRIYVYALPDLDAARESFAKALKADPKDIKWPKMTETPES